MSLRLSVAMPTYNGERFIRRQLETIVTQSPPPDELVISDDGSTDATLAIARSVPIPPGTDVHIIEGTHEGLRRNVERALTVCSGDVIVLSDQDDLWRPGKTAAVARAFEDEGVTLWFSDADVVDEAGSPFGFRLWQAVSFSVDDQEAFRGGRGLLRLLRGSTVTGATMAFRADILPVALPLPAGLDGPDHLYLHDGWIAVLSALRGKVVAEPHCYTGYRQHGSQFTGMQVARNAAGADAPRRLASHRDLEQERDRVRLVLERIRGQRSLDDYRPRDLATLIELSELLTARTRPPGPRRLLGVLRESFAGRYRTYARGWRTAAADVLLRRR